MLPTNNTGYYPPSKKICLPPSGQAIEAEHNYHNRLHKQLQQQTLRELVQQDPFPPLSQAVPLDMRSVSIIAYRQDGQLSLTSEAPGENAPNDQIFPEANTLATLILYVQDQPEFWFDRNEKIITCIRQGADLSKVSLTGMALEGQDIAETTSLISKHFCLFYGALSRVYPLRPTPDTNDEIKSQHESLIKTFNQHCLPPLHNAINKQDERLILELIKQNPQHIESRDFFNRTPLLYALDLIPKKPAIIECLIRHGKNTNHEIPFMWEVSPGKQTFIKHYNTSGSPLAYSINEALQSKKSELSNWMKILKCFFQHDVKGCESGEYNERTGSLNMNIKYSPLESIIINVFLPLLEKHEKTHPDKESRDNTTLEFPHCTSPIPFSNFTTIMQLLVEHSTSFLFTPPKKTRFSKNDINTKALNRMISIANALKNKEGETGTVEQQPVNHDASINPET